MSSHNAMNPNGGASMRRVIEQARPKCELISICSALITCVCQRTMGEHSLSGYGPIDSVNRPVRTRMLGGVGAGGEKPPATRLGETFLKSFAFAHG
jgi:hypothetical protein